MTQFEFYKSFQFVLELLIAESVYCYKLSRRSKFWLRLPIALAAIFLFSFFFPILSQNAFYVSFMFFCIFAVTFAAANFLFAESWLKLLFCMLAGYTTQHLAYEFYNLLLIIMGANKGSPHGFYGDQSVLPWHDPFIAIIYFWTYLMTYFILGFVFGRKIERGEKLRITNTYIFIFAILLFVIDIILNAVVVFLIAGDSNNLVLAVTGVYNIVCCIVVLLFQFEVSTRHRLEDALQTVKLMRQHEREQYAVSKENIELINLKCHDLKHQIRNIGSKSSMSEESVREIENIIQIYDSAIHTGNEALDTILTEKMLSCNKRGIKLSCIIDGDKLSFMSEGDIYSLFGNLVDNAMEAVASLDEGQRIIGLKVRAVDSLVSVNIHNYYSKELTFKDGLPLTDKNDKKYHGYGMKSIRYICDKYGGDLSVSADGGVFNVNMLFDASTDEGLI